MHVCLWAQLEAKAWLLVSSFIAVHFIIGDRVWTEYRYQMWSLLFQLDSPASKPLGSTCLCPQKHAAIYRFYGGARESNSGSCACEVST